MTYDPNDPEQVQTRRRQKKAKADPSSLDIQWVVSDPRGRRAVARILEMTGMMSASFVPGDPHVTAFREGQRDIGIKLHRVLISAGKDIVRDITMEPISTHERDNPSDTDD